MPSSLLAQWDEILRLAASVKPQQVLDVGPGAGKAAVLFRERVPSLQRIQAIEVHRPYIAEFHLNVLYDQVRGGRFEEVEAGWIAGFDLVLMIDVIEHIEEGSVVPALRRVPKHLLVCTPDVFDRSWVPGMPASEEHVSVWSPEMVERCGFRVIEVVHQHAGWIGLFERGVGA